MTTLAVWISAIATVLASLNGIFGRLHSSKDNRRFAQQRGDIDDIKASLNGFLSEQQPAEPQEGT